MSLGRVTGFLMATGAGGLLCQSIQKQGRMMDSYQTENQ
ncbi:hypothetical protein PAHA111176_09100 [Parendozoicomonas haliclonae]|uniref:Uncharacterized protein n=1 Tax=Parendozoicomonas haliclonae TaxID=1960125 RepID=A0A1X7APB1_9GAMM|nr:hypothetical protein EHSB41UT_03774 [Parendozoicomonas haliclonae]